MFIPFRILIIIFFGITFLLPQTVMGGENDFNLDPLNPVSQAEFKQFSQEAGLALSYMALAPAEPLGLTGFDFGIEVTAVDISQDTNSWTKVLEDSAPPDFLLIPKIHLQKGLPFKFDVGLIYSKVPESNASLIGGELKWAVLKGSTLVPAVAVRGAYTRLLGVSDLDLETYQVDLSVSKGIAFLTPYAGLGELWINSKENAGLNLNREQLNQTKGYVGVKATFLVFSLVAEATFASIPTYTLRTNVSF